MAFLNSFRLFIVVLGTAVAYIAWFDNGQFSHIFKRAPTSSTEVINFCKNRGDLAMTFDGGPGPATASVIMGLNANKVKATFHVTTEYLKEVSVVSNMRAAHESGHVIGLRFPTSLDPTTMTEDQLIKVLLDQSAAVYKVLGIFPKYLRVPYGSESNDFVRGVAERLGFVITTFNIDSFDYQTGANAESMVTRYNEELSKMFAGQGAFISVHQDLVMVSGKALYSDQTILAKVISNFRGSGYQAVTLDTCTGNAAYRAENIDYRTGGTYKPTSDASSANPLGVIAGLTIVASLINYFF